MTDLTAANQRLMEKRRERERLKAGPSASMNSLASKIFQYAPQPPAELGAVPLAGGNQPPPAPHVVEGDTSLWRDFDTSRHPALITARQTLAQWLGHLERTLPASPFDQATPNTGTVFILAGGYGAGKSHLAEAICAALTKLRCSYLQEFEDVVKPIQANYKTGNEGRSLESIAGEVSKKHLLLFDDLGDYETDNFTWMHNIYRTLLGQRMAAGRHTLITTNLNLAAAAGGPSEFAERLGGRTYSRVFGGTQRGQWVVKLWGVPDYRLSADYAAQVGGGNG